LIYSPRKPSGIIKSGISKISTSKME